jgi:IS30 family transposase
MESAGILLATAVQRLNNRPRRKCLGYQSPNEVFMKQVDAAF